MSTSSEKFRHVTFADAIRGSNRAINFGFNRTHPLEVPDQSTPLDPDEDSFVKWLFREAGLDARFFREETLRRRLPACLRLLRVNSIAQARVYLRQNRAMISPVMSVMLIGVTSFFRDPRVFNFIRNHILPRRLARSFRPRIWSIGCSDGSELYSIAMALAEVGSLENCELIGTDCRPEAISRARTGVYEESALRGLPANLAVRYFLPLERGWMLRPEVRNRVQWRSANVLETIERGPWDLILCRNVSMYMKSSATQPLWQSLQGVLVREGYLVLGKAERPTGAQLLSMVEPCIFRRDRG
ncbi:MAG TPA: CheR family methyltransferase [Tepidisphaeraceae bacterium]|jgi:chemotaxis methyl-accepting protein methylase|nr:CheR family methyltransferase [Tepidisphaeraceae bacterium]